jgi:DNA-binding MarR family transcriptional regulator
MAPWRPSIIDGPLIMTTTTKNDRAEHKSGEARDRVQPDSTLSFASQSATHLLHRAGQHAEELFARASGELGITARQFIVLAAIDGLDKPSQTTLCDVSGIDRSTLADIVRRLEMRGLIHRQRTKTDARMYAVNVTEEGRSILMRAAPIAREVEEELLAGFSEADREAFKTLLGRIMSLGSKAA